MMFKSEAADPYDPAEAIAPNEATARTPTTARAPATMGKAAMPRRLRVRRRQIRIWRAAFKRLELIEEGRSFRFRRRKADAGGGAGDAKQRSQECTSVHFFHPSVVPHEPVT